jgi:hypothetical protein
MNPQRRIAFDLDDTLWMLVEDKEPRIEGVGAMCACGTPVKQEVDPLMMAFVQDLFWGDNEVFLWSAGGVEYVNNWIDRFAPAWKLLVQVISKEKGHNIDICFDDQDVDLATVNFRIKREHSDHWHEEEKEEKKD